MNRAERRRLDKEQKKQEKSYTLTQSQLDKIKADAVTEASSVAFILMLAIPVMILHDKWWVKTAKERCPKFIDQCLKLYNAFDRGEVTLEELRECLWEESGIKVERSDTPTKRY